MNYSLDHRLNVVLNQIVPAIVDHPDKEFQSSMLDKHEIIAEILNLESGCKIADIQQFFQDARDEIERQTKNTKRELLVA